jgi:hypothetical protein
MMRTVPIITRNRFMDPYYTAAADAREDQAR